MDIQTLRLQPMDENCYIIDTGAGAVLIDPGDKPWRILETLEASGLTPTAILLTHGHYDHIGAVYALWEKYHPEIYIHPEDAEMLTDPEKSLAARFGIPQKCAAPTRFLREGDVFTCGELSLKVLETPGHTLGSVCYLGDGVIFTGDTLFLDSIGRTDFPGGSRYTLYASLQRLTELDENLRVLPGHGPATTISREIRKNPFLN